MKQNERLLVYAVTGFLAVILVIAVVFGREPGSGTADTSKQAGTGAQGLSQLLDGGVSPAADGKAAERTGSVPGLPTPAQVVPAQPLVAGGKTLLAADLIEQQLGANRRDRMVRFVHARPGDSLESLVRRWCGARDPFLAEAKSLNEDLVMLRAGQEVGVPWVEDETVLALLEAQKPRLLASVSADASGVEGSSRGGVLPGDPAPSHGRPSFAEPGRFDGPSAALASASTPASAPVAAGTTYTVKSGDSLWRISERTYGRQNADRMLGEIRKLNPDLVADRLAVGKKIVLPAK